MSDALVELEQLLPDLPAGVEHRRLGHHLATTLQALADAERQIGKLSALLAVAKACDFTRQRRQQEHLEEMLDYADDLASRMTSAATAEDVRAVRELYEQFTRHLSAFERGVRTWLKQVMDGEFGGLLAIGRVFEGIEGTADLGVRLVSCAEEARSCADTAGAEDLLEVVARLRALRLQLEAERAAVIDDPEVGAFVDALVGQEATLRHVTEPVIRWLTRYGALDSFRVRGA